MKIVGNSTEQREIGSFPQVMMERPNKSQGEFAPDAILHRRIPEGVKSPSFYVANKKSKLTDHLVVVPLASFRQQLVSSRFVTLLNEFPGLAFDTLPAAVKDNDGKERVYTFVNFYEQLGVEVVDFSRSRFQQYDYETMSLKPITFRSYEAFKSSKGADTVSLTLKPEVFEGLHHFFVPVGNRWVVSDELAAAMKAKKITGLALYDFTPETDISLNNLRNLERSL